MPDLEDDEDEDAVTSPKLQAVDDVADNHAAMEDDGQEGVRQEEEIPEEEVPGNETSVEETLAQPLPSPAREELVPEPEPQWLAKAQQMLHPPTASASISIPVPEPDEVSEVASIASSSTPLLQPAVVRDEPSAVSIAIPELQPLASEVKSAPSNSTALTQPALARAEPNAAGIAVPVSQPAASELPSVASSSIPLPQPGVGEDLEEKIVGTSGDKVFVAVEKCKQQLSGISALDVADALHESARFHLSSVHNLLSKFRSHSLELSITACRPPNGQSTAAALAALPLSAAYALFAFICIAIFASIYYPRRYTPVVLDFAKKKYDEYQVAAIMALMLASIKQLANTAYSKVIASPAHTKAVEYYALATEHVGRACGAAARSQIAKHGGEVANRLRTRLGDELTKMRAETHPESPV
uniref:Uncharacterized protein n=1 Tax=Coccolithus braarudii TaxID=221442 RepID=A0A7S0PZ96_9EUKA